MLFKYKYEKWLKDTVKFKNGLNSVINSIDERIDSIESSIEELFTRLENYALKNHNHDERYSNINHKHDDVVSVGFFKVNTTSGTTSVKIDGNLSSIENISFGEYSEYFTVRDMIDGYAVIDYDISSEDVNKVFQIFYTTGGTSVSANKFFSLQVNDTDEPNVKIRVSVVDSNGDPVESGTVHLKIVKLEDTSEVIIDDEIDENP